MSRRLVEELVFMAIFAAVLVWMLITAMEYPFTARLMPQVVAIAALVLLGAEFIQTIRRSRRRDPAEWGEPLVGDKLRRTAPYLLWIAVLYVAIALVGLVISAAVFTAAFCYFVGGMRWWSALFGTAILVAFLFGMAEAFNLDWPVGYFFDPFR